MRCHTVQLVLTSTSTTSAATSSSTGIYHTRPQVSSTPPLTSDAGRKKHTLRTAFGSTVAQHRRTSSSSTTAAFPRRGSYLTASGRTINHSTGDSHAHYTSSTPRILSNSSAALGNHDRGEGGAGDSYTESVSTSPIGQIQKQRTTMGSGTLSDSVAVSGSHQPPGFGNTLCDSMEEGKTSEDDTGEDKETPRPIQATSHPKQEFSQVSD
jgi:hypothetical protein